MIACNTPQLQERWDRKKHHGVKLEALQPDQLVFSERDSSEI
jgi:hypothetical protein